MVSTFTNEELIENQKSRITQYRTTIDQLKFDLDKNRKEKKFYKKIVKILIKKEKRL